MSLIIGNGILLNYLETEVTCPVCTFEFDVSDKMEKAKYPVFKMKCPACKSALGVSTPIFGGELTCYEWNVPKGVERQETKTPNRFNGKIY